jgi:hypothetical protein
MTYSPAALLTALRDHGVPVVATDGWATRGYDTISPVGQVNHHTGSVSKITPSTAAYMIAGRPPSDPSPLPGPLCNGLGGVAKDTGRPVFYLIAGRRARHAGPGSPVVLSEIQRDVAPSGDAGARGLADDENAHGNRSLLGWEWQPPADRNVWPDPLIELVVAVNAATADLMGWSANRSIHHREWTARKPDMSWRGPLRQLVADRLNQEDDMTPTQAAQLARVTTQVGDLLQRVIGVQQNVDRLLASGGPAQTSGGLSESDVERVAQRMFALLAAQLQS